MKLLFDESLSPKLADLLGDLFPESESALKNGLAGAGDARILDYAASGGFILVSTDADFERLSRTSPGAKIVHPFDVSSSAMRIALRRRTWAGAAQPHCGRTVEQRRIRLGFRGVLADFSVQIHEFGLRCTVAREF